jgi:flagellar basal body-associated protein FliL
MTISSPTTSADPSSPGEVSGDDDGPSGTIIIIAVVVPLVLLIVIVGVLWWLCRRKKGHKYGHFLNCEIKVKF